MNLNTSIFIILCLIKTFQFQCLPHQYPDLHTTDHPICKDCPDNCSVCYLNQNSKVICTHCVQKFYLNPKTQKCESCYKNCLSCEGPSLKQCFQAELGYQYNEKKKELLKCEIEGCLHCSTLKTCSVCMPGYITNRTFNKETKKSIVQCEKCGIDNCKFCIKKKDQITKQFVKTCKLCTPGYGKLNNKCEKCNENCSVCGNDYQKCQICKLGYYLDKKNSQCVKINIDFCYALQQQDESQCKSCFAHFYLQDKQCKPCQAQIQNCQSCKQNEGNNQCSFCILGYFLKDNKCQECPENCKHCDTEKCHMCVTGYYYNASKKKCQKCKLKNCRICQTKNKCLLCQSGYYFDKTKKACTKCKDNCIRCSQDGKFCYLCPLNYMTLNERIINENVKAPQSTMLGPFQFIGQMINNIFNKFLSQGFAHLKSINVHKKCVKKCPEKIDGQKVYQDKSRRVCTVQIHEEDQHNSLDDTIKINKDSNILEVLNNLQASYEHQLDEVEQRQQQKNVEGYSAECNYYGKLHKEIKGNMSSYYVCKCEFNQLGDNCEISMNLFNQTQRKLLEIFQVEESRFAQHNIHEQKILFKALAIATKFKTGIDVIEKMIGMIQQSLVMNREIENSLDLYVLLDSIVLNVFDLLEDLKREDKSFQTLDIGSEHSKERYYKNMHILLQIIENSLEEMDYVNSFLNPQKHHFYNLDTFSFMINEYKLQDDMNDFEIDNPNIDTSFNINENTKIKFELNQKLDEGIVKENVQVLNYSAMIFMDRLQVMQKIAVSNIIYVKFVSSNNTQHLVSNKDIGLDLMHIEFPLLFIPAFDTIEDHVECLAISFYTNKEVYKGQVFRVSEDDDSKLGCDFRPFFDFRNYYFGIFMDKQL